MPNTKKISMAWSETAKTVYAIIRREADSFRLNDADGAFATAPTDPYLSLAEDAVIKGLYEVSEARTAWNNGNYLVFIYRQTAGSPAPVDDIMIGSSKMEIVSDTEVDSADIVIIDGIVDSILADTNELQTDWVNGGRLDLLIDATLADTNEVQTMLPSRDYLAGSTDSTGAIVDKTGYTLGDNATNIDIIAGAIWDSLIADYGLTVATFGYILKVIIAEAEESAIFASTPSDAELCTLALYELGQEGINNVDDGTKRSILCKYFYPIIRDAVLRAYPWNFAITRQALAQEDDVPLYGFTYSYALPTLPYCLRALEMEETANDATFKIEGRHLYTDEGTVNLKYIARITNAGLYDSLFREVLIARMAATLAYPMTRTQSIAQTMWALYEAKLREARTQDGMEGTVDSYESDDLTSVR